MSEKRNARLRQRRAARTPEQVVKDRSRRSARTASRTPEQVAKDRTANKEYRDSRREHINRLRRKNMARRSPEQLAKDSAAGKRRRCNLTLEKKQALAERQAAYGRKRRANRTPEQKATRAQAARAAWGALPLVRRKAAARSKHAAVYFGEYAEAWLALMQLEDEQKKQTENNDGK